MLTYVSIAIVTSFAYFEGWYQLYLAGLTLLLSSIIWDVVTAGAIKKNVFSLTVMCFVVGLVTRTLWESL